MCLHYCTLLQLTSIKEAARQISELAADEYAILARLTAPDQHCSISLDIFEPIATQLSQLTNQHLLDDQNAWTNDSGAVSDYDSSACDFTESVKGDSFSISQRLDHSVLVTKEKDIDAKPKEVLTPEFNNASSLKEVSEALSFQVKDIDSQSEADMFGGLLHKVKDHDTTSDTESVLLLHDQEPEAIKLSQSEAIMVADLEKSFFSSKPEYLVQPEKNAAHGQNEDQKVHLNIRRRKPGLAQPRTADYGSSRTHAFIRTGHWQSRGGQDRGRRQRSISYGGSEHTYRSTHHTHKQSDYYQATSTTETQHPKHNRARNGSDQVREHRVRSSDERSNEYFPKPHQLQSEPRNVLVYEQIRSNSNNNSKSRGDDARSRCNGRKHTKLEFSATVHHQQEPSPLILHSQNMWSANQDIIKSVRRNTTGYHPHHMHRVKDNIFNHYEVGCFLLEGKLLGYQPTPSACTGVSNKHLGYQPTPSACTGVSNKHLGYQPIPSACTGVSNKHLGYQPTPCACTGVSNKHLGYQPTPCACTGVSKILFSLHAVCQDWFQCLLVPMFVGSNVCLLQCLLAPMFAGSMFAGTNSKKMTERNDTEKVCFDYCPKYHYNVLYNISTKTKTEIVEKVECSELAEFQFNFFLPCMSEVHS